MHRTRTWPSLWRHIDTFMQKRRDSSALAMESRLFCIKPSRCHSTRHCAVYKVRHCCRSSFVFKKFFYISFPLKRPHFTKWLTKRREISRHFRCSYHRIPGEIATDALATQVTIQLTTMYGIDAGDWTHACLSGGRISTTSPISVLGKSLFRARHWWTKFMSNDHLFGRQ